MTLQPFNRTEDVKGIRKDDIVGYWTLRQGDTAQPLIVPRFTDKSVQMFGNWSGGATVRLLQTNDPDLSQFEKAYDPAELDIEHTGDSKVRLIYANCLALMPEIDGGDANTEVIVAIVGHGVDR